jgi:ABC-type uncharacterized transport system permease subunit
MSLFFRKSTKEAELKQRLSDLALENQILKHENALLAEQVEKQFIHKNFDKQMDLLRSLAVHAQNPISLLEAYIITVKQVTKEVRESEKLKRKTK